MPPAVATPSVMPPAAVAVPVSGAAMPSASMTAAAVTGSEVCFAGAVPAAVSDSDVAATGVSAAAMMGAGVGAAVVSVGPGEGTVVHNAAVLRVVGDLVRPETMVARAVVAVHEVMTDEVVVEEEVDREEPRSGVVVVHVEDAGKGADTGRGFRRRPLARRHDVDDGSDAIGVESRLGHGHQVPRGEIHAHRVAGEELDDRCLAQARAVHPDDVVDGRVVSRMGRLCAGQDQRGRQCSAETADLHACPLRLAGFEFRRDSPAELEQMLLVLGIQVVHEAAQALGSGRPRSGDRFGLG